VAYTRNWMALADALKRVVASGVTKKEAKTDLCGAIADREMPVQLTIAVEPDVSTAHRLRGAA
jgi:hypothetical protein